MKPDISLVLKSGHFHLLPTLPGWPRYIRSMKELPQFGSKNSLAWLRQATEPTSQLRMT